MVVGRAAAGLCNMVHQDESWKAYVQREAAVAKKWQRSWGFLRDEYQTMTRNIHAVERCGRNGQREREKLKLPPITAPKQDTTHPFPLTSSREVGWRSARPECNLEIYGRWGRPKYSIIKHLKWPSDAVP